MGLDVYLRLPQPSSEPVRQAIFIRRNGEQREVSRAEWDKLNPGREPLTVTVGGEKPYTEVFTRHMTSNLGLMASRAEVYFPLWHPGDLKISRAEQLIEPLTTGLAKLQADPEKYRAMNPPNGWGTYGTLVDFVTAYLEACQTWPEAEVTIWR